MNTSSTNMYALHEHGESHDESSESEYKLKKKSATENNGIRDGDATETEVDPDSILGDDLQPTNAKIGTTQWNDNFWWSSNTFLKLDFVGLHFNMDGLKDMLKCASCQRFLFPPILQCVNGHMECRICFDMKPQCGKCHQKMVDVPAKFAEMITEQFNVQCTYAEKGCTESVAYKVT